MTDQEVIARINDCLNRVRTQFLKNENITSFNQGISRLDYYKQHNIKDQSNYHFALSAQDIIDKKIPYKVAGCTGTAKLFSKYAMEAGLTDRIFVVPTVNSTSFNSNKPSFDGHQIIAILLEDGMHLFDPAKSPLNFIPGNVKIDEPVDALGSGQKDHIITGIMHPEEFAKIDSRNKLQEVYMKSHIAKTAALRKSKEMLDFANKNRELTQNNYNKSNAIHLANQIIQALQPIINNHIDMLKNWSETDYEKKKQFVKEALEVLLNRFPSETIKPKILFKDDVGNIDVQKYFGGFSAAFFAKETSPWAADTVKKLLGNDEPLFIFMDDLKGRPLGQIAHEFTHYLQATNQSTISPEVLKQSIEYYPHINGKQQTHNENIQEAEAIDIGDYVRQQTRQMLEMSAQMNIITQDER